MTIGSGDVEIKLGDKQFVLSPSLGAAMQVSAYGGSRGLVAVNQSLMNFDLDMIQKVIIAGFNGAKRPKNLEQLIYESGAQYGASKAIEFVNILSNGGKRIVTVDKEEDGDEAERPPEPPAT